MTYFNKKGVGSEHAVQEALRDLMHTRQWCTHKLPGNAFLSGFPDLYCIHRSYGARWVEVKKSKEKFKFTNAQIRIFSNFQQHGIGVWILFGPQDYDLLFKPPNWQLWLRNTM